MLNAAVPSPTATRKRRRAALRRRTPPRTSRNAGACPVARRARSGLRASCFQSAMQFSTIVSSAAPWITWIRRNWLKSASRPAEDQRTRDHADQQHHVEQRDDARPRLARREVGGQREAGGLRRVQAGADQQERERRADLADERRPVRVAGQHDQRERHDREAAELQQRAHPDDTARAASRAPSGACPSGSRSARGTARTPAAARPSARPARPARRARRSSRG